MNEENNLTEVTEEVMDELIEVEDGGIGAGTVITGVCAATGAAAIIYGLYKAGKWGYNKVKNVIDSKKSVEIQEDYDDEDEDFEIVDLTGEDTK